LKFGRGATSQRAGYSLDLRTGLYTILQFPNIVWCMAYKREVGGGVVYCAIL